MLLLDENLRRDKPLPFYLKSTTENAVPSEGTLSDLWGLIHERHNVAWAGSKIASSLSLSLVYVAALPAQAQSSRSSSTNSTPGLRVTPTAVPSAVARSQKNQVYSNSCLAPIYESMSGGVPYTSACERKWIRGKYVCRHYARDFCQEILPNGSNQVIGSGCWPLSILLGPQIANFLNSVRCLPAVCKDANFLTGHVMNVFRSGGQEVIDRYGEVAFSVVEPQEGDGSYAVICSWRQKSLEPKIPVDCRKQILGRYFAEQVACGFEYDFKVWGLDDFRAEVARQDKEYYSETSKP